MKVPIFMLLASLVLFSCRTKEEIPPPQEIPKAEKPPARPFETNWEGSTWIIPHPSDEAPAVFPGYHGFHLGRKGRLLLIGMDSAIGDTWLAEGNRLEFNVLEGLPAIPLEGSFDAFYVDDTTGQENHMRLVPEQFPESEGLIFQKAEIHIDMIENLWIPKYLDGGQTVAWPGNKQIHIIILPAFGGGTGIQGYGGRNRFRSTLQLGEDDFIPGDIARRGSVEDFESLLIRRISETTRYIQVKNDLFLYNETRPTIGFRVKLFD